MSHKDDDSTKRIPIARSRLSVQQQFTTDQTRFAMRSGHGPRWDILYRFRYPRRNGKTGVIMDPVTFLSRLGSSVR